MEGLFFIYIILFGFLDYLYPLHSISEGAPMAWGDSSGGRTHFFRKSCRSMYDSVMKLLLALYFFILAIIQLGLFFGIYHYYRKQDSIKPSAYWLGSLLASILALSIFGFGILAVDDISVPQFNFTIGNSLFYLAAVLQSMFCLSLNRSITRFLKLFSIFSTIVFLVVFELMRLKGNFEIRTAFMCIVASGFYIWQILEIRQKKKQETSTQLAYLQYASCSEFIFALLRLMVLVGSSITIHHVDQIPQILVLFTVLQLVMNTLSYIAIGGYWAEKIAIANIQSRNENEEIKALLIERESLIASLLKANKTASTGALSASIAHELNQPLGASSLNIQFLQKKLSEGSLSPDLQKEILDTLLADNRRAANIIRTLRSIFSEVDVSGLKFDIGDTLNSVLLLVKPELTAKHIQIVMHVEPKLMVMGNASELQQVFLNLMNNAIQALIASERVDKQISIIANRQDENIQIIVADNGGGVPPIMQHQLFELLTSTKGTGMGLGLWLCKHIVTRHAGNIEFEPNEGGGAKFMVDLPATA